jgi:hypothetical protein
LFLSGTKLGQVYEHEKIIYFSFFSKSIKHSYTGAGLQTCAYVLLTCKVFLLLSLSLLQRNTFYVAKKQ